MASNNHWKNKLELVKRSTATQRKRIREQTEDLTERAAAVGGSYLSGRLLATGTMPAEIAGLDSRYVIGLALMIAGTNVSGKLAPLVDGLSTGLLCAGAHAQAVEDARRAAAEAAKLPATSTGYSSLSGEHQALLSGLEDSAFSPV